MAESIRGLTVEISADASSFNKEMSSMRKAAQQSQTELNALQKSLELEFDSDKFARAQKVAQNAIDQTAATGAELDDLSLRLGISAEKVQEYQYVTAQAGVEWDTFEKALIKARAAIVDLSAGTINNASKALQSLGLRVENFDSKEAMFDGIIDALSNMEDKTLQTAYANEIFGDKIANQMLPYLNAGTDAINQFKSEFETIGALSNEQVAALAKLDDTIYLLKESLKNVCLQIGASFAPLLQRVAEIINTSLIPKLQKLAEWFNSLTIEQQAFAAKVLLVVAALAPLALGIGKVVSAIGGIIKLIPALQAGLSALAANPIILIIAVTIIWQTEIFNATFDLEIPADEVISKEYPDELQDLDDRVTALEQKDGGVTECIDRAHFPDVGVGGVIYIDAATNTPYRYDTATNNYVIIGLDLDDITIINANGGN